METEKLIQIVTTDQVANPFPQHHFSLGTIVPQGKKYLFLSGQIPLDPKTNQIVGETAREQATQVLQNICAVLKEAGSSFEYTVQCTLYLADYSYYQQVNEVFGMFCPPGHQPARSTVAVLTLPKNVKVEIDTVAIIP